MLPENLPYYRGPRITLPADSSHQEANTAYCECLQTSITSGVNVNAGTSHLSRVPVQFGDFNTVTPASAHASTNHEIPCLAQQVMRFGWAVYSFGGGHFASTITSRNLPFCIKLACDQYKLGSTLFREFTSCKRSLITGTRCWTTFADPGITPISMVISFILFG